MGDIVIAVDRVDNVFIGKVLGAKLYQAGLADSLIENLVGVDFIKNSDGEPKRFSRMLFGEKLNDRLKSARMTITDLDNFRDEIIAKLNYLEMIGDGNLDEAMLEKLAVLCDKQSKYALATKESFDGLVEQMLKLL
ncbi:hypothetical protein B0181_10090 [Moraxella caviae]|uniref:Uncharacterized protein n=2 Tax=Moraxella caviae TaxID=34060 RepID=A0A1S9ZXC3_9GAMM|nr:hypothetical protein B0181_10090 [Moraxella caviae]STZ13989.1 Uncharacterised protein [Moraxella caviae]VEW13254.1 Uncharacterised protein [Moraxella caviae]